jgi:membrane protease YdiL (CAAX protease family)
MENIIEQDLSILKISLFGLLPGIPILFLAWFFSSPSIGINLSIYLAVLVAIVIGLVPTELGILKYIAWKNNKKIKDMILFVNKTTIKKFILSIIIPLTLSVIVMAVLPQYENKLWKIFNFIPDWFRMDKVNLREIDFLKFSIIIAIPLNGLIGTLVEELYFRGFLLPRMQVFGKFAPLINSILFSLYHFFSPWEIISRILGFVPIAYSVWINKNIKIGIIIHCLINIMGMVGTIVMLLS